MSQPIVALLRYSLTLKAAMAECIDTPEPKPVHRLRSTTRRMEAILELLAIAADLPHIRKKEKPFRKYLRKIRQSAGEVRDIDVHLDMLAAYKSIDDAAVLEKDLNAARKKSAKKLQRRIEKDQRNIQRALDDLETILAPIVDFDLSAATLTQAAQSWLASAVKNLDPQNDEGLHSIRKACKTARYICEIGAETSQAAAKLAKHFNDVQQITGTWHDYLLLLNEAHDTLPNDSPLIEKIHARTLRLRQEAESKASHLHITAKRPGNPAKSAVH